MIRLYAESDLAAAAELYRRTFGGEPWNENWSDELAGIRVAELMMSPLSVGYVFEENGRLLGLLCGRKLTYLHGAELMIDELCVSPDVQRCGIGTKLLDRAAEDMASMGVVRMVLNTVGGFPSENFYRKNGFVTSSGMIFMCRELATVSDKTKER